MTVVFSCPVCSEPLQKDLKAYVCPHGHSFDIAREGYVNLLLKKSAGDTKEMLHARRHILEHGYYAPLSQAINALIYTALDSRQNTDYTAAAPLHILDAGCGEGYYLGRLRSYLLSQQLEGDHRAYIGMDISKDAIKMAARRYQGMHFVVADLKERLVFADTSLHVITNIFAPRNASEFARVMIPGGILLVVIPGSDHLWQLRSRFHLLRIEENKQQHIVDQFAQWFELHTVKPVAYTLHLSGDEARQAIIMTPNYWHMSEEMQQTMGAGSPLEVKVSFICLLFQRKRS